MAWKMYHKQSILSDLQIVSKMQRSGIYVIVVHTTNLSVFLSFIPSRSNKEVISLIAQNTGEF